MILTGKAEQDYMDYVHSNFLLFSQRNETAHLAHVFNWLDSTGIHVAIDPHIGGGADVYYAKVIYRDSNFIDTLEDVENPNIIGEYYFSSRQEATRQAILEANKIYNENSRL